MSRIHFGTRSESDRQFLDSDHILDYMKSQSSDLILRKRVRRPVKPAHALRAGHHACFRLQILGFQRCLLPVQPHPSSSTSQQHQPTQSRWLYPGSQRQVLLLRARFSEASSCFYLSLSLGFLIIPAQNHFWLGWGTTITARPALPDGRRTRTRSMCFQAYSC